MRSALLQFASTRGNAETLITRNGQDAIIIKLRQ